MKSAAKWTPEPWEVGENLADVFAGDKLIARNTGTADLLHDIPEYDQEATVEEKANARLMATAPVLLKAAKDALYALDLSAALLERGHSGRLDKDKAIGALRTAITQAEEVKA